MRAATSENSGPRKTTGAGRPWAVVAAMPSMRSAARFTVLTRPAWSRETTPVATASSTVSV